MCFEGSKEFPNHLVNTLAHIIPLLVLPLLCVVCFESLDNQLYYCPLFLRVHGHKFHIPIQGRSYLISREDGLTPSQGLMTGTFSFTVFCARQVFTH